MARIRKPSWKELRQSGLLENIGGEELFSRERMFNLLEFLEEKEFTCDWSSSVLRKSYLTKEEYESIRVTSPLGPILELYTQSENQTISKEMKDKIMQKRNRNRNQDNN